MAKKLYEPEKFYHVNLSEFKRFLQQIEHKIFEYETEDEEAGWYYINSMFANTPMSEIEANIAEFGEDKVVALNELAKEENVPEDILKAIIKDSSFVIPVTGKNKKPFKRLSPNYNFVLMAPIGEEVSYDLSEFSGILKGRLKKDLYHLFKAEMNPDDWKAIKSVLISEIHDDTMLVPVSHFQAWGLFIDPEEFLTNLENYITKRISKEDMEETKEEEEEVEVA